MKQAARAAAQITPLLKRGLEMIPNRALPPFTQGSGGQDIVTTLAIIMVEISRYSIKVLRHSGHPFRCSFITSSSSCEHSPSHALLNNGSHSKQVIFAFFAQPFS
jgi:hypothetical protein